MEEAEFLEKLYPESAKKSEYIICAAIHFNDGKHYEHQPKNINEGFVICGRRHHNCYMTGMIINDGRSINGLNETNNKAIQGFLTSKDVFVDRKEAAKIAIEQNQVSRKTNCLFSEDLY